jgi:hypothetical protein
VRVVVNSVAGYLESLINGFIKVINVAIRAVNIFKPGKGFAP